MMLQQSDGQYFRLKASKKKEVSKYSLFYGGGDLNLIK